MTRRFDGDTLVLATHNKGKVAEFRQLLAPYVKNIVSAGELELPEPEETGATFLENATLKACAATKASKLPALADDGGLCIAALGGEPGLFSGRWAQEAGGFRAAMQRLHEAMGETEDRSAYFICSLVLAQPNGETINVEGRCDGVIVWPPRGTGGHDFDPFFQPTGKTQTFAEMTSGEKHAISHRGKALRELVKLFERA